MIKKILTFATYIIILINSSTVFGAPKSKSTYEYLDLFGQVFDRVNSSFVVDVSV